MTTVSISKALAILAENPGDIMSQGMNEDDEKEESQLEPASGYALKIIASGYVSQGTASEGEEERS